METKNLFPNRLKSQLAFIQKYLKKILNDHLLILASFVIVVGGHFYIRYLTGLESGSMLSNLVFILAMVLTLSFGQLASFISEADQIFLRPREDELEDYRNQSLLYSLALPSLLATIIILVMMPWLMATTGQSLLDGLWFLLIFVLLKLSQLLNQEHHLHFYNPMNLKLWSSLFWILVIFILLVAVALSPSLATLLAVVVLVVNLLCHHFLKAPMSWPALVAKENRRQARLLNTIAIFADVPAIDQEVKERPILAKILPFKKGDLNHPYRLYYSRVLARSNTYYPPLQRLTILVTVLLFFINYETLALILIMLVSWASFTQLIPMFYHGQHNPLLQRGLSNRDQQIADFTDVIRVVTLGQLTLLAIVGFIFPLSISSLAILAFYGLFFYFASPAYIKWRVTPKQQSRSKKKRARDS